MKFKTIALTGVMSLAGLGLIGAGAHAVFTTTTSSVQTLNAGTASVLTWSAAATNGCTTETIAEANPVTCQSVTLPAAGPLGSVFDTPAYVVAVVNTGTLTVYENSFGVTDNPTNGTFQSEIGMCISSDGGAVYNGMLTAFPDFNVAGGYIYPVAVATANSLAPGATDSYAADFYAGEPSAQSVCGSTEVGTSQPYTAATTSLTTPAEGGSDTVTLSPDYGDVPA